jgi:septal ring factor EnvC (AmiA/AmiB activator)
VRILAVLALLLAAQPVAGATREEDLAALRARISALKAELQEKESSRQETRDALKESESAISELNRTLQGLDAGAREAQDGLKALQERGRGVERALAGQQAALARVLEASYVGGAPGVLQLSLAGKDPNDAARQLYYTGIISAAAARLVENYRKSVAELAALKRGAEEQAARVAALESAQRAERERLVAERRERQRVLERIAGDLRKARRQIGALEADESRLSRVVSEIARVLSTRPGAGHRSVPVEGVTGTGATAAFAAGPFSRLQGKLRFPVRGELIGRFGAPHGDSTGARKGIFIRSREGEPVRAVGAGRVVFADWMRGFGNLLIVDHGESYLSIYGNNESLLKQTGDPVAPGEPVATVGATGGNEQTGLYFELRHLGKAFDPLRWVGR